MATIAEKLILTHQKIQAIRQSLESKGLSIQGNGLAALSEAISNAPISIEAVPVGMIVTDASGDLGSDWAICDGSRIDAASHPELEAVLGSSGGLIALPRLTIKPHGTCVAIPQIKVANND